MWVIKVCHFAKLFANVVTCKAFARAIVKQSMCLKCLKSNLIKAFDTSPKFVLLQNSSWKGHQMVYLLFYKVELSDKMSKKIAFRTINLNYTPLYLFFLKDNMVIAQQNMTIQQVVHRCTKFKGDVWTEITKSKTLIHQCSILFNTQHIKNKAQCKLWGVTTPIYDFIPAKYGYK